MAHDNPYPWAILPRQFVDRLGCDEENVEVIERDRQQFSLYCLDMARRGIFCKTQLEAWENYCLHRPFFRPALPTVIVVEEPEPLTWEDEWLRDSAKRAQFGNYSDSGGQQ